MNNSVVYLDNAATTPLSPSVFKAMEPFLGAEYFTLPLRISLLKTAVLL